MQRVLVVLAVAALLVEVYGIVSCALTPGDRLRRPPKPVWLLVVVLLPVVGPIAWIVLGRERSRTAPRRGLAPDDDPARFGAAIDRAEQDRRIARLEAELAALDAEGDDPDADRRSRG